MKVWRLVPSMFVIAILGGLAPTAHGQGLSLSDEFQVNDETDDDQRLPSVAVLNGGGLVVAWESAEQDINGTTGAWPGTC